MTTTAEQHHKVAERRDRHLDGVRTLLAAIAVALLGLLAWNSWASTHAAQEATQETADLAAQVQAACGTGGAAAKQLETIGACRQAREAAAGEGSPTVTTQVATDDQVRVAVADYLSANPPRDGRTPTAAEVDAAVARFCETMGCRGDDGTNGTNGENGTDGTDGLDGADASDDQVATQVAAWCSENNGCLPTAEEIQAAVAAYCSAQPSPCVGPQGPEGQPGPVLPEYYTTRPNGLGTSTVTLHCVLRPDPPDAEAPPHYDCEEVPE
jgi:type II secretory pathway component PulJ